MSAASAPGAQSTAYDALVRLTEQELELAGEGRYNELAQLSAQRTQIIESLSAPRPAGARESLERALALQTRVSIELLRRREQILIALRRIDLHQRAAHGYGRSLPQRGGQPRIRAEG